MNSAALSIKNFITSRTKEIASHHRGGADSFTTCSALTATMDEAIQMAFQQLSSHHDTVAVLALGGYGRGELCPKSDVDVMVLAADADNKESAAATAKQFLHLLWDSGIDVGHSVRTVKEAMQVHGKAIDSWASMLESRFLCGDKKLAEKFYAEMRPFVEKKKDKWFVEAVFEEVTARHARFGNSIKLLEPNVKKSAGGLRDFQSLFWLYRANDPDFFFPIDPKQTASRMCVDEMVRRGLLDEQEGKTVLKALQFLLRTRHEMHFRREAPSDALEYSLQQDVAEALGFGARAELRSVEVFMREYYLHARTIYRLHQNLSHKFREMVEPVRLGLSGNESLGSIFFRTNDMLSVDPQIQRLSSAAQVFEAFALSAEHEIELHVRLRRAIANSTDLFTSEERSSAEVATIFRKILCSRCVAKTLHNMNELNVLAAYLPEWAELVAFFQHNMYHYFTADEHTLIALAKAERLREETGVMREVFRNLPRKETLYLAILLHDIAKPRGVGDHEITGVEMARQILDRIGMADTFGDVAFLIRNHLVMEQVAFRRNIHDPATMKEFAVRFETPEQLDYLYLLTYTDLSAMNINVWTEWKSSLLQELYQLTSEVLRRNLKGVQIDEFKKSQHEVAVEALVGRLSEGMPRERVHEHLQGIGSHAYIALFTDDEIEQHIHKSASEETVSTIFTTQEGHTEITVIAANAPFALSRFCAVLSANDANIFDANVFTREDGIIIDRFRVSDAVTKGELNQASCNKIAKDLNDVMESKLDIKHLFEAHRRKWKRRQKPANPNIRTDVQFEENPNYTIIDVYAPDSLGFLYRVTETISKLGLDIYFAKIATRVDGILDAFYVLDRAGNPIVEPEKQETIRIEILNMVKQISEQELSSAST